MYGPSRISKRHEKAQKCNFGCLPGEVIEEDEKNNNILTPANLLDEALAAARAPFAHVQQVS